MLEAFLVNLVETGQTNPPLYADIFQNITDELYYYLDIYSDPMSINDMSNPKNNPPLLRYLQSNNIVIPQYIIEIKELDPKNKLIIPVQKLHAQMGDLVWGNCLYSYIGGITTRTSLSKLSDIDSFTWKLQRSPSDRSWEYELNSQDNIEKIMFNMDRLFTLRQDLRQEILPAIKDLTEIVAKNTRKINENSDKIRHNEMRIGELQTEIDIMNVESMLGMFGGILGSVLKIGKGIAKAAIKLGKRGKTLFKQARKSGRLTKGISLGGTGASSRYLPKKGLFGETITTGPKTVFGRKKRSLFSKGKKTKSKKGTDLSTSGLTKKKTPKGTKRNQDETSKQEKESQDGSHRSYPWTSGKHCGPSRSSRTYEGTHNQGNTISYQSHRKTICQDGLMDKGTDLRRCRISHSGNNRGPMLQKEKLGQNRSGQHRQHHEALNSAHQRRKKNNTGRLDLEPQEEVLPPHNDPIHIRTNDHVRISMVVKMESGARRTDTTNTSICTSDTDNHPSDHPVSQRNEIGMPDATITGDRGNHGSSSNQTNKSPTTDNGSLAVGSITHTAYMDSDGVGNGNL